MKLFNKGIGNIYIIDILSDMNLSGQFVTLFEGKIPVELKTPTSKEDLFAILDEIAKVETFEGILIHLIAHGNENRERFVKDANFIVYWKELVSRLTLINEGCDDSLIINASNTCFSDALTLVKQAYPKAFHAAIYSIISRFEQAFSQNVTIYGKWLNGINMIDAINEENDLIYDSQDDQIRPFGYIGN
ncbi:hypothetical protein [Mucilaginibacter sp. OK098]|uniref:hypothetical protein n=1 Tax=Mucilaginibacter sp. OK098 TaxID=1855297 RepID=UPI0009123DB0|nr:hypothetical protein [Mucilaginibacter sp. OK098]SHN26050.1 hypothetical protein SAMN05216524_107366 [Mucilaginibacter sp. OK098]